VLYKWFTVIGSNKNPVTGPMLIEKTNWQLSILQWLTAKLGSLIIWNEKSIKEVNVTLDYSAISELEESRIFYNPASVWSMCAV
jgi:hypothetical protein